MYRCFLIALAFIGFEVHGVLAGGVRRDAVLADGVEVFTGYVHSHIQPGVEKSHPVRLFLLPIPQEDHSLALFKYSHGDFSSIEYATYVYRPVDYQPAAQSLDLEYYPNDGVLSLPRIFLNRTKQGWEGQLQSLASNFDLTVELKAGWRPPALPQRSSLTQSLSGHYLARSCKATSVQGKTVKHRGMVLFPKRGTSHEMFSLGVAEAGMKMQNYVGALVVESELKELMGSQNVGSNLKTGRYNFYNHTLEINFGRALLFCWVLDAYPDLIQKHRISGYQKGDLWCRSTFYEDNGCHYQLKRSYATSPDLERFEQAIGKTKAKPVETPSAPVAKAPEGVCHGLHGQWYGVSKLARTQKSLPTKLDIVARYKEGLGCVIHPQLEQELYRTRPLRQRLAKKVLNRNASGLTLLPYDHSDSILVLDLFEIEKGILKADWFSTIFGYAGTLQLQKGKSARVHLSSVTNPVYALAGFYDFKGTWPKTIQSDWVVRLFNAGIDVNVVSSDPSRMFGFNGYLEAYAALGTKPDTQLEKTRIIQMEPMRTEYFDYFTNRFLIHNANASGSVFWFGQAEKDGLRSKRTGSPFSRGFEEEPDEVFWKAR